MSKRRPRQDGEAAQLALDIERTVEIEDDPELPPEERLERAIARWELRFREWEDISPETDLADRIIQVEQWIGRVRHTEAMPGRSADHRAFALDRLEIAPKEARVRKINELRGKGLSDEKRHRAYEEAADNAALKVLDNHGAALWLERLGNDRRLHRLLERLSESTVTARAA